MCNTFIFQSLGFRVIFARGRSEQERARLSGSGTTSMSCGRTVGINLHHFLNSVDHPAALMCRDGPYGMPSTSFVYRLGRTRASRLRPLRTCGDEKESAHRRPYISDTAKKHIEVSCPRGHHRSERMAAIVACAVPLPQSQSALSKVPMGKHDSRKGQRRTNRKLQVRTRWDRNTFTNRCHRKQLDRTKESRLSIAGSLLVLPEG